LLVSRAAPSTVAFGWTLNCVLLRPAQEYSFRLTDLELGLAAARKMLDERRLEGAWKRIIKTSNLITLILHL